MIKFVVYDDEIEYRKMIKNSINNVMSNLDIDYKIEEFATYNSKMMTTIDDDSMKIYIMDIQIPNGVSGIDVARKVRIKDWNSIIILVTAYNELGYEALKAQIMLLDFISKFNDCSNQLNRVIKKAVSKIDNKKVLIFESSDMTYRVYTDDIIYILKDSVERKSIIKTDYNEIVVNQTITNLLNMLDSRFFLSHRSCIINTDKVDVIDWKNNIIHFKNGEEIDYLARDKKKELREYVRSC